MGKSHYLLYHVVPAMRPRWLITVDEDACLLPVSPSRSSVSDLSPLLGLNHFGGKHKFGYFVWPIHSWSELFVDGQYSNIVVLFGAKAEIVWNTPHFPTSDIILVGQAILVATRQLGLVPVLAPATKILSIRCHVWS